MSDLIKKLSKIQAELKAPKNQHNKFGNYNYRSCEDILEALKPHLSEHGVIVTISDDIVYENERFYVRATATITDGDKSFSTTAYARESVDKKGMDSAQITGASSSYARKYALNGLFLIDDTKDADATNDHDKVVKPTKEPAKKPQHGLMPQPMFEEYKSMIDGADSPNELFEVWKVVYYAAMEYDSNSQSELAKIKDEKKAKLERA